MVSLSAKCEIARSAERTAVNNRYNRDNCLTGQNMEFLKTYFSNYSRNRGFLTPVSFCLIVFLSPILVLIVLVFVHSIIKNSDFFSNGLFVA